MSECQTLLIELGTEELPPKALKRLSDAFAKGVGEGLEAASLSFTGLTAYATPRRLAVSVHELTVQQPDRVDERRGPAVSAAFDADGNPTKAALGFARSCGRDITEMERLETDKGAWLIARSQIAGRPAADLIDAIVEQALSRLPIPKRMRWGSRSEEFVRPVHWLVMMLGEQTVPGRVLGLDAGNITHGHRFHCTAPIELGHADEYATALETDGHVIADFAVRRGMIRDQVVSLGAELGGEAAIDEALLDEVTALVEWPVAIAGGFDARYLEVPSEALISTMQGNQKYFPVTDPDGTLMPHFITISNIDSSNPNTVRNGNERVIRPRFADAEFFWNQDRKLALTDLEEPLKQVIFQTKLGSLHDRAQRVSGLAAAIATDIDADVEQARLAGRLSKCDLLTSMVGEFPELQGIMGRYYALHDGHPEAVAAALDEQYMPRFAGDQLPAGAVGQTVALADKLDTMVGIFGIGQRPTGDRDPFALRRAAIGVLRIAIECRLEADLPSLLETAVAAYGDRLSEADTAEQVLKFLLDRLRGYYLEAGLAPDLFDAVATLNPGRPFDFDQRIRAVGHFRSLPEAASLAAANKRVRNILRQNESAIAPAVDTTLLVEGAETALFKELSSKRSEVAPILANGDYSTALATMASLRPAVDRFFDEVMVMDEDAALRANRLALLSQMDSLFMQVADLSMLQA